MQEDTACFQHNRTSDKPVMYPYIPYIPYKVYSQTLKASISKFNLLQFNFQCFINTLNYFISYPGIKNYLDNSVKEAKEKGYSVTMFGRRRPIPELTSGNFMQRQFGERVAMNSPIQGSAADIMKIAMINVAKELKEKDLKSKIVLQVHDELLIEAYENEVEQVKDILKRNMEQAAHLNVPLDVDVQVGNNWDEAH